MHDDQHGPLYFDPSFRGLIGYGGETDEQAWARYDRETSRLQIQQAWAERIRMTDTLGWWESAPPLPDMLTPAPEILAVA